MPPRISTRNLLVGGAVGSGVLLLVARAPWLLIRTEDALRAQTVSVSGTDAAPTVGAVALVALASAGALSIAGPRTRSVILIVGTLAAALAIWAAARVLLDPTDVASGLSAGGAGGAGVAAPDGAAGSVEVTAWPGVGLLVALGLAVSFGLGALGGVASVAPAGRFSRTSASVGTPVGGPGGDEQGEDTADQAAPTAVADPAETDSIDDDAAELWDSLSRGNDPTA